MAKTYKQIQDEIEVLTRKAEALRQRDLRDVVAKIKDAITVYGLTAADLGLAAAPSSKTKRGAAAKEAAGTFPAKSPKGRGKAASKVAVKYRDKAGNAWSGRGNQPRWLRAALAAGGQLDNFKV